MARNFLTVAIDLVDHAECAAQYFEHYGYKAKVEPEEIEYPYVPTLRCKRPPKTMLVVVDGLVREDRAIAWSLYARACQRDTEIAMVVPADSYTLKDISKLQALGVGLYSSNGESLQEVVVPLDLALKAPLPALSTHPPKMRKVLGPVYEEFQHSQWREGFEDACQAVEGLARKYLLRHMKTGRVTFVTPTGKPKKYAETRIKKMPMGPLADAFAEIKNQNYSDSRIGKVLRSINKDRVGVAHYKGQALQESRLRKNVGRHMFRVFAVLRELLEIK